MKFPRINHYMTGVALPVSSLKSKLSCGTGEFSDLKLLAPWLREINVDLLQILPVNDTGAQSSPYSALSAFALHPVYIRLEDLPGAEPHSTAIEESRRSLSGDRVNYASVRAEKDKLLRRIFESQADALEADEELQGWIRKNRWIKEYAVFKVLKEENLEKSWLEWRRYSEPKSTTVNNLWKSRGKAVLFHSWVQFHLEKQFLAAAEALQKEGIALKGDIPIMMNDDSADIWAHRDLFDLSHTAGSPPDGFSPTGQNWGFPVYNWKAMEQDGYAWWKKRLKQADKFYHAYRIDHVLGFFRIWNVPAQDNTAGLGHFTPARAVSAEQLNENGFSPERITWLSQPHIFGADIRSRTEGEAEAVMAEALEQLPNEDIYLFKEEIRGEKDIRALPFSEGTHSFLEEAYRNRTLIELRPGLYVPSWTYQETQGWNSLSGEERERLSVLFEKAKFHSEELWEEQGRRLLQFMKETTKMLVCAEDLGAIPACVPDVLEDLGILGLRVNRWARRYDKPGAPYISVKSYPFLSVCTPSVHDTSTMRQWWKEEQEHSGFFAGLEQLENHSPEYTPETAHYVLEALLQSSSLICIFQIQELFSLSPDLRTENPDDERINLPGTVSDENWSYQIKPSLEELTANQEFTFLVARLFNRRRQRTIKTAQLKEHNLR